MCVCVCVKDTQHDAVCLFLHAGYDLPSYNRPSFPGTPSSTNKTSPDSEQHDTANIITNPLAAFDTRDVSI